MRRFEFVDSTSNKFWEVVTEGPKLRVCFGHIGGTWQEIDKLLDDAEKASLEMEKLIWIIARMGYLETDGTSVVNCVGEPSMKKPLTLSPAERKTIVQEILLMFANGQWEMVHNVLETAQDEEWLFEQLLNGCKIEDGKLIPSNAINKSFKKEDKNSPILAMLTIILCNPCNSKTLKSFKFEKLKELDFGAVVKDGELLPWISRVLRLMPSFNILFNLDLDGLTSLSDGAAEALSKIKGSMYLRDLKSLSSAEAKALSAHEGYLVLDGLTILSDGSAEALSNHNGDLSLSGLVSLGDSPGHVALAIKLASDAVGYLNLDRLTTLGPAAAEALSKHQGELFLSGLKSLSEAAADALSKHEGKLDLSGLTSLSEASLRP